MSVLQVLTLPDDRLRTVAKPVKEVTPEIQKFVDDMIETMYDEEGIRPCGNAGRFLPACIVVIDISKRVGRIVVSPLGTQIYGKNWYQKRFVYLYQALEL